MTHIYRGVKHDGANKELFSSANFSGVYRGARYTNKQNQEKKSAPQSRSWSYRGVSWVN